MFWFFFFAIYSFHLRVFSFQDTFKHFLLSFRRGLRLFGRQYFTELFEKSKIPLSPLSFLSLTSNHLPHPNLSSCNFPFQQTCMLLFSRNASIQETWNKVARCTDHRISSLKPTYGKPSAFHVCPLAS